MGCGGRGSVGRAGMFAGRLSVSDRQRERRRRHADERRLLSVRPSRVVLAPVAGVKFAEDVPARPGKAPSINPRMTVAKRNSHTGESTTVRRQTIAQGRPDALRWTCMLVCALLCAHCTRDRGCSAHPVFPAPSFSRGRATMQTSGSSCREIAKVCLMGVERALHPHCRHPRRRVTQYSRDSND